MNLTVWITFSCLVGISAAASASPTSTVMGVPPGATDCANGPANSGGNLGCYVPAQAPNTEVWTIEKPRVDVKEESYPLIRPRR